MDHVEQKIWTFHLVGGERFLMQIPHHPDLKHNGRRTIWKFLGTKVEANQLEDSILKHQVRLTLSTEEMSEDQHHLKQAYLGDFSFLDPQTQETQETQKTKEIKDGDNEHV